MLLDTSVNIPYKNREMKNKKLPEPPTKAQSDKPIKPPTKAQLISLMVEEAVKRRADLIERIGKEIEDLEKKAIDIASKVRVPAISKWETRIDTYDAEIEFSYTVSNKSIVDICKKIRELRHAARCERNKTKSQITAEIRAKLGTPKAPITDPETLKSINDRLTQWGY